MRIELSQDQQSMLVDVEMFIGENWVQFQAFARANDLVEPQEAEIEALFEIVTGNKS